MIDHQATLALIAELALAVVGFAGVAAAFGGRERAYLPIEKDRLRGLFAFSFTALATSLLAISLPSFPLVAESAPLLSSLVGSSLWIPTAGYFVYVAARNLSDPESSTDRGAFLIVVIGGAVPAALYSVSIGSGGHPGLLAMALSAQVLFAVWVFMRVLIHRT